MDTQKKYFFAVLYIGGNKTCTTGQPNSTTGRYSRAIDVVAFRTRMERDQWVGNGLNYDGNGPREAVNKKQIFALLRGCTLEDRQREIETAIYRCEEEGI